MDRKRKVGVIVLILLLGFLLVFVGGNWSGYFLPAQDKEYFLMGNKGKGLRELSQNLENDNLIFSAKVFRTLAVLVHADKKIQNGVYHFSSRMSLWEILKKLKTGEVEKINLTVREGDDLYDIGNILVEAGLVESKEQWLEKAHQKSLLLKIENKYGLKGITSLEGFLYPETYRVKKKIGLEEFLEGASKQFDQKIFDYYSKNKPNEKAESIYYYLKAASLIEKETASKDERPLVSSVLDNRLKIRERLRFDPTIIYALKVAGLYEANLRNGQIHIKTEHFTFKSPFNTYAVSGLPQTPIANPSLESFIAAMRPAKTEYLFFVAKGPGSREHVFSKTFAEHQKFVDQYQLGKPVTK